MDEMLDRRLRAIVGAGWRAAVIGMIVFLGMWGVYVAAMHIRPEWVLDAWGGLLSWETVQMVSLCMFGALKLLWFVFLFGVLFVELLRRRLARAA